MKMNEWNFGDSFPSLEIDTTYWQTLNGFEKLQYLKRLVFQEKDFGNRINVINFILSNSAKVGRSVIKNPAAREYLDIVENSANLISILAAAGNVVKAKQTHKTIKNNEIAKMMGFPNGNYVNETKLDITSAMCDAFVDISEYNKKKFLITIDNLVTDDDKKQNASQGNDEKQVSIYKTVKMTGTLEGDTKWGMIIKSSTLAMDEEDTTSSSSCKLYYATSGSKMHSDQLRDKLQKILYALYIDKVDTYKNYVKIKGTRLEICERKEIDIEITNIDVPHLVRGMRKVLEEGSRRAVTFIGEPGTGKTICVHKVTNEFRDRLVFWVSPDSINSVAGIRNVFKIFKMFENSIMVFDDLDSGPFTGKDEVTGEFIAYLDGTNNNDLKGFIIGTVNDPSKLHASLINRPERIDDVIEVKNPQSSSEIANIIFSKAAMKGYYPESESDDYNEDDNFVGVLSFEMDDPKFIEICEKVLEAKFTQAQVAGLINYCHVYSEDSIITLELLDESLTKRIESIKNANKVAVKGGRLSDSDNISPEAMANLSKKRST